jgi:hypothetical protein
MSIFSSETSVDFQWTTGCYIPEDRSLNKGEIRDGDEDKKGIKEKEKETILLVVFGRKNILNTVMKI